MHRQETDFINLGGLNYEARRFNRSKGVVEYGDLTHVYHPRVNESYMHAYCKNPRRFHQKSNPITQYAEDAVLNGDRFPFRVGRYLSVVSSTVPTLSLEKSKLTIKNSIG
jgi:hypothetical protein